MLVVTGAEFLVSMVEARWTARNGDGRKMESATKSKAGAGTNREADRSSWSRSMGRTKTRVARSRRCMIASRLCAKTVTAPRGAWEKTELARHPQRPYTLDYIERIFTDWSEIHGDRGFADDPAIVCGMARFHGEEVMVIGHQKARDTKQKVYRNFGMPNPEGYRKGFARNEDRGKIRPASVYFRGYSRRVPRPGRGRARPGGSHCPQPARDGAAAEFRSSPRSPEKVAAAAHSPSPSRTAS